MVEPMAPMGLNAANFLALPASAAQAAALAGDAALPAVHQTAALMAQTVAAGENGVAEPLSLIAESAFSGEDGAKARLAELISTGRDTAWARLHASYTAVARAIVDGDETTLAILRGTAPIDETVKTAPTGIAEFVPIADLQALLASAFTRTAEGMVASGMMVFDTAMPAIVSSHADSVRRLDHHGDMGDRADNTVGQLVEEFRDARERAGISVDETVAIDDDRLNRAVEYLNIRFVTTDNLADGLDAVLMAENQKMFLADPRLLERYEKAMRFVDFDAFSPAYADCPFDQLPDEVKLALAIYGKHDEALKNSELKFVGADRFAPENARAIAKWELPQLRRVIEDRKFADGKAQEMWRQVRDGAAHARANGVIAEIMTGGAVVGYLYNNAAMKDYGYFAAQMAFARAHPDAIFYTKVIEFPAAGVVREDPANSESRVIASSRILIAALPYGQTFPNGETMRGEILAALKNSHEDKARELGVQAIPDAAKWAVRDDVIVTVGGTFLAPADMKAIIEEKLAHLFAKRAE